MFIEERIRQVAKLHVENRSLSTLKTLKKDGGPFTNADDVEEYVTSNIPDEIKQKCLHNEVVYARDTSMSLPRASVLFKIMNVDKQTKKRKKLSAEDFAKNLKLYLGKVQDRSSVSMDDFRFALRQWH